MGTVVSVHASGRKNKKQNKTNRPKTRRASASIEFLQTDNQPGPSENKTKNQDMNKHGVNDYCIRADDRAAIVVHGCQEEYQTLADEVPELVCDQVAPNLIKHPMLHGEYCLVRDDENDQDHLASSKMNTINSVVTQKSEIGLPIYGMSQPSCKLILKTLRKLNNQKCLVINVRSDPCLFSFHENDWFPYALRNYKCIGKMLEDSHQTGKDLEAVEVKARDEVMKTVKATRETTFYFYDDITFFENQPTNRLASAQDYLLVSEEVYYRATVGRRGTRYIRLNFAQGRFPLEEEVDTFVDELRFLCADMLPKFGNKKSNEESKSGQPITTVNNTNNVNNNNSNDNGNNNSTELPNFIITGHKMNEGTVQLGLTMAHLALRALHTILSSIDSNYKNINLFDVNKNITCTVTNTTDNKVNSKKKVHNSKNKEDKTNQKTNNDNKNDNKNIGKKIFSVYESDLRKGKYHFVKQLGRYLPFMVQIKEEVDQAIDDFGSHVNLREQILDSLIELKEVRETDEYDKSLLCKTLYETAMDQMERYHMLICYNAYLREQMQIRFSMNFSNWMKRQPRLYQMLDFLDVSEWYIPVDMLKYGHRILVADSSTHVDELSTRRFSGLNNFRQLAGWPIYGSSQPDTNAIVHIHNVLTKSYWNISLKNIRPVSEHGSRHETETLKSDQNKENRFAVIMPQMIWICLRDDYTIKIAGETCSWRSKRAPDDRILLRGISGVELEKMEQKFAVSVSRITPPCKVYSFNETGDLHPMENKNEDKQEVLSLKQMFKKAFEPNLTNNIDASSTSSSHTDKIPASYATYLNEHAEYYRIPMPRHEKPPPPVFDQILRLLITNSHGLLASTNTSLSLKHACCGTSGPKKAVRRSSLSGGSNEEWKLPNPKDALLDRIPVINLLFFCENGRERTSLGMSIAGLIYCHLFGFMFGYRVDEEERISLRDAKYTKGEFVVIEKLVRILPRGYQLKREVDYVLDRCYDSMSMMHFHIREEIYFTYVKTKDEKDPEKKMSLYKESLAYLEKYFFLILFNAYLHDQKFERWKTSFESWLQIISHQINFMDILDNFGFPEFETPNRLRRIRDRWRPNFVPQPTLVGDFA